MLNSEKKPKMITVDVHQLSNALSNSNKKVTHFRIHLLGSSCIIMLGCEAGGHTTTNSKQKNTLSHAHTQNEIEMKTHFTKKKKTILSNFLLEQFLANRLQNWVWQFLLHIHFKWQLSLAVVFFSITMRPSSSAASSWSSSYWFHFIYLLLQFIHFSINHLEYWIPTHLFPMQNKWKFKFSNRERDTCILYIFNSFDNVSNKNAQYARNVSFVANIQRLGWWFDSN